jgi:hypothetical protein
MTNLTRSIYILYCHHYLHNKEGHTLVAMHSTNPKYEFKYRLEFINNETTRKLLFKILKDRNLALLNVRNDDIIIRNVCEMIVKREDFLIEQ